MKEFNNMYKIKEVTLKQGEYQRKRLVIEFENPEQAILGELLMTDAPLLSWKLLREINSVLSGELSEVKGSGNRTSWIINAEKSIIEDLHAHLADDIPSMKTCVIETRKLYDLLKMWAEKNGHKNTE